MPTKELVLRPLDYVTKLVSGLLAGELPLEGNPVAIHTTIPGPGLLAPSSVPVLTAAGCRPPQ